MSGPDVAGAHWSLLQTAAWILTRDEQVVQRCSKDANEARAADRALRSGRSDLVDECFPPITEDGGAREHSVTMWAAAMPHRPLSEVDPANLDQHARASILRALRRGELNSTTKIDGSPTKIRIGSGTWADAEILVESRGEMDVLCLGRRSEGCSVSAVDRSFGDCLVPAAEVIALWPVIPPPRRRTGGGADDSERAEAWMKMEVSKSGTALKRDDAIERCCRDLGITVRVARAAWKTIPGAQRRGRGDRDRPNRTTK